jgi:hypothetical protein
MRECLVWLDTPQHKGKGDKTICHNIWKILTSGRQASFQVCRRKWEASIKRKREEGIQERKMNFQNIWLKGNISKK